MRGIRSILTVTIILVVVSMLHAQHSQIRFEHLDDRDGLSHNRVTSIFEDDLGFMWMGTLSGLNHFDGTEIKVYRYDENDPYSLSNSNIIWIKEGPNKQIWIKTSYGVYAYDIFKEKFVNISEMLTRLRVDGYNFLDIIQDKNDHFWFLLADVGISQYDPQNDSIYKVTTGERNETSIQLDNEGNLAVFHFDGEINILDIQTRQKIKSIQCPPQMRNNENLTALITSKGDYWLYAKDYPMGVCFFDTKTGESRQFGEKEFGSDIISGIVEDSNGEIVIGADHYGLSVIGADFKIKQYVHNPADSKSLSHNSIVSLYSDRSGTVWIGTNKGGINYYSPQSAHFSFYKQTGNINNNENDVLRIVETPDHNLWIASDGGGLVFFDRAEGKFKSYSKGKNSNQGLSSNIIVSMISDGREGLWIGTYLSGLNHFDGKTFTTYRHDNGDENTISDDSIWSLFIDSRGNLWVGTLTKGIDVYDKKFRKILHLDQYGSGLSSNYITAIREDADGKMWIGTGYGVDVYDPKTETIQHIRTENNGANGLSNNTIVTLLMDKEQVWVGTMHGLNRITRSSGQIISFTKNDGLPHNLIASILKDHKGDFWLGTYQGLSKMTIGETGLAQFENFDVSDGLQGDIFNERSATRLQSGELVFGGKNGINIFDPAVIESSVRKEKLVFLDFYLSNQQIRPGEVVNERTWFENGINATNDLVLEHDENSFSIGFKALNFYQKENTIYKYRLIGFDKDWVVLPNIRRASYTNLDPGKYRFEVQASVQTQPEGASMIYMDVEIKPPFWQTPLAYLIYVVIILGSLYFTRNSIVQKERFRAKVQQERIESKRMHDLDMMKIKFFTNISHEFRTPLSLIITPLESLMTRLAGQSESKDLHMIHRNAKRLLTLVNQLLDFRRMEAEQHQLALASGDLILFLRDITNHFTDISSDRKIDMDFHSEVVELLALFDRDKVEKIMFNLLSNAFKFTHEKGNISVLVSETSRIGEDANIRIVVKDTGIGIPKDKLEDVFKRFFQVENSEVLNLNHGSGIGLSITKEFVEMHNGSIRVESELGKGSAFIVDLKLKTILTKEEVVEPEFNDNLVDKLGFVLGRPTLLVVDDNIDFRFYLAENLRIHFNVIVASNGKVAWKKAMEHPIDLIVTDIMMPEMNGIELCQKVKKDPRTAHIPVILLTARYSDDQKMEGYDAGASEYITKPFNFEILLRSIQSSVKLQKFIHAVENRKEIEPSEINIVSLDEKLLSKALQIVEDNMSNADFSVQGLSHELGVSRGQLYKKTLEITGKTPIEFIRLVRLKRAAALLEKSQLTVAEVAYKVGFNNPKYFTKYFREEFQTLPSKYSEKYRLLRQSEEES
jgi:signal transduction histidine kinase/ligand-binding sensor domain-containing protein/DNA-binding response OmpR family regulator